MRRGGARFIVLEGLDGAGTTTQAARLAGRLREEGCRVVLTREPSDGPVGALIRQALTGRLSLSSAQDPLGPPTLALLFAADRLDHLSATVEPALRGGSVVVSDRYVLSSLAYQGVSLPLPWLEALNGRARRPDLTFYLEVGLGTAAARRRARGGPRELFDAAEVQRRVSARYAQVLRRRARRDRVVRVDGNRPADVVASDIFARVRRMLHLPGGPPG